MADSNRRTLAQEASTSSDGASHEAHSLSSVHYNNSLEDLNKLELDLNPNLRTEQLKLLNAGLELKEEEEDDEEDEEEELSEEQKQQMQQLTSIVNNAFRRADLQRNLGQSKFDAVEGSSVLGEVEFSSKKNVHQELPHRYSIAETRPGSPFVPLPLPARMNSVDSQSTHTSDFCTTAVVEDGNKLLETLGDTPDSLEKALTLNQALQRRFSTNIERLETALKQNLQRQLTLHYEEDEDRLSAQEEKQIRTSDSRYFLRISSFCKPYFKSKIGMPVPMNEDAKFRVDQGYLDMYQTRQRPWSRKEDRQLQLAVQTEAKIEKLRLVRQRENAIKRKMRNIMVDDLHDDKEMASLASDTVQCQEEIKNLQRTQPSNISVPPTLKLDWIRIAAQASDGHRTPYECEYRWCALLSLNISQKNFSEKDDIAIQAAVRKCGRLKPDWQAIASQLSEPRSAFQVFRRYRSFISRALNPVKWDEETSSQLLQLVEHLRVGEYVPWHQVHQQMPGFTRSQLQGQWKKLNPERRKGPFTKLEDSLFIRGILKFGLNFQQIAQFMPQRSKEQLKDRFRRSLIAVFKTEWTREMDDELQSLSSTVEPCFLNSSFWRRLAAVPGFANSGKDAAMLRLRFLILQLWQEISLSDETPPPLFPVTITTSPEEIALVNKHFLRVDIVEMREIIDKINAGNHIRAAMFELEQRRVRLHQEHDQHMRTDLLKDKACVPVRLNHLHMHHLYQHANKCYGEGEVSALNGRSIIPRSPSVLSWPEQLILEFFLPAKSTGSRPTDLSSDMPAVGSLQLLMKMLQLRPMPPDSCDTQTLEDLNITEAEVGLAHLTANQHICKTGDHAAVPTEPDFPCVWCSGNVVPEGIPLLPPSAATVGALQNLLIHRRTLRSMANKSFVLHRFKGPNLYRLGDKPRSERSLSDPFRDYEKGRLPMPGQAGKIHITSGMVSSHKSLRNQLLRPKGLKRRNVAKLRFVNKRKKKAWAKRSIIEIYKSFKSGKNLSQYKGPKKPDVDVQKTDEATNAESEADPPSGTAASITETFPELVPSTSHVARTEEQGYTYEVGASTAMQVCTKQDRPQKMPLPESWAKHFTPTEPSEDVVMESSDSEDEAPVLTTEEVQAHTEADNLLWHRFLAVFLWPAIMSFVRPLAAQEQVVAQQHEEKQRDSAWETADDGNQRIAGAASSILQEVSQVVPPAQRRKRKRVTSPKGKRDTDAPAKLKAKKKVSAAPTRRSARQKTPRHVE
ncbi:SANT/Myb domain [Trinorchestia longiramus]|nr:SANT/Myb domain [Trinorchestia longiramus]